MSVLCHHAMPSAMLECSMKLSPMMTRCCYHTLRLLSLQNHWSNQLLFFIITLPQVFCYSSRKWIKNLHDSRFYLCFSSSAHTHFPNSIMISLIYSSLIIWKPLWDKHYIWALSRFASINFFLFLWSQAIFGHMCHDFKILWKALYIKNNITCYHEEDAVPYSELLGCGIKLA